MSEEKSFESWIHYWDDVVPRLEEDINNRRIHEAEKYLVAALGFYSYTTEELPKKVEKQKEVAHALYPLLIELQDILRASFACQRHLVLATSAFNLRAAFEIYANILFISKHDNPSEMCQRLIDFFEYEKLVGLMNSIHLPSPTEKEIAEFVRKHPYWGTKDGKSLKESSHWTGEPGMSMKTMLKKIDLEEEYYMVYKLTSKFMHGSPIVKNMYKSERGLGCMAHEQNPTFMNLMAGHYCMEALMIYCGFFGVPFEELNYRIIQQHFLKVKDRLKV